MRRGPGRRRGGGKAPGGPLAPLGLCRLSKKWLAPLFRGFHSSLAPTARPGSYAEKPLLRKAFCGVAVHAAKSDYSLRGLRPPNPRGFFDRLSPRGGLWPPGALVSPRGCRAGRLGSPSGKRRRPPPVPGPAGMNCRKAAMAEGEGGNTIVYMFPGLWSWCAKSIIESV